MVFDFRLHIQDLIEKAKKGRINSIKDIAEMFGIKPRDIYIQLSNISNDEALIKKWEKLKEIMEKNNK